MFVKVLLGHNLKSQVLIREIVTEEKSTLNARLKIVFTLEFCYIFRGTDP